MRQGFTLIEMLVALAISVLLINLLFSVLYQTNRAVKLITRISDGHTRAVMAQQILTRDLSGVFIPVQYAVQQREAKNKQKSGSDEQQRAEQTTEKESDEDKKVQPLTKIFYAHNQDSMLHELTFITTNPLPSYTRGQDQTPKPRIARVWYTLVKDEHGPRDQPSFTLFRRESVHLDAKIAPEGKESTKSYPVITHIKNMSARYTVLLPAEQQQKSSEQKKEQERVIKTVSEWNVEAEGGNQELIQAKVVIPTLVEITLVLWSTNGKRDESYTWSVWIAARPEVSQTQQMSQPQSLPAAVPLQPPQQQVPQQQNIVPPVVKQKQQG